MKPWMLGVLVLGMAGCAGTAPVVVKTVDAPRPTEQILENRLLGFSIAHLAGWELGENLGKDGGGTISFVAPPRQTDAPVGAPRGTVGVTVQPLAPKEAATPESFVQLYLQGFRTRWPAATVVSQSSTVVRGRPAIELVVTKSDADPQGTPFMVKILGTFFVQGSRGYLIYYNHEVSRFDDHLAARRRMLDTFEILDPSP